MNKNQLDGITKARLVANIELVAAGAVPFEDDAAYLVKVCADAGLESLPDYVAESYAAQHAGKTIAELEKTLAEAIDKSPKAPDMPAPVVDGVPVRVSMRQARLALLAAGKLHTVDATIDAMPEPNKSVARIEWEYAAEVRRDNALIAALGPALGMSGDEIDALFVAAAKL